MTAILRRKRLADGTFGELEKVFDGETAEEVIARLENDNAALVLESIAKEMRLADVEQAQASLLLQLIEKGAL